MLEIFANNERLHLPEDITVNMTWENPFLLQDRIPPPYSLSFTLPGTPGNYSKFGNPQRLTSSAKWSEVTSRALFNNVTFLNGKLNLQEVEKKLKVYFQGDQLPGSIRENMDDIELERFDFGAGSRFFPNFTDDWSKVYLDFIFSNATTGEKFACCPVRVEDEDWPWGDYSTFGIYAATTMYLNFFNVATGKYFFDNVSNQFHTAIFPQPYIHYLIDSVFGEQLVANPFRTDPELRTLVITTSFHKLYSDAVMSLYKGVILDSDYNTAFDGNYFYMNSFLNAFAFNEFLKDLLKIFCFSLMPRTDGKWDIVHNKTILESTDVEDWSNKLTGTPTIGFQEAQTYTYGYSNESGSNQEEGAGLELDHINALLIASEGTYRIKSTGEVYEKSLKDKKEDTDPDEFEYELKKSGLCGNTDGDDAYSMISDVSPLNMCVGEYWTQNSGFPIPKPNWYVPVFSGDRTEKSNAPFIGFNRGYINLADGSLQNNGTYSNHYPFLTPFNKDLAGNTIGNLSLAWDGPNGLIEKFHKEFKTYIEKDKTILTGYFQLSELDLKNMDYQKKKHIRGKQFFLQKTEASLKLRKIGLVKCELIEA